MNKQTEKIRISCFIIARDEEERIGRTIKSVIGWVDEVIIIDSGSIDKTVEISKALGCQVIQNEWLGYGPQKRFGEEQCRHDWVLNLDADEVISPPLQKEIINEFQTRSDQVDSYRLHVIDILPGRNKPLPLARTYNIVRLYNQRKVRYSNSPVHDRVETQRGRIGQLDHLIYHYSMLSISHAIRKLDSYSNLQAKVMTSKAMWKLKLRLITEFPLNFLRFYILRGYFMAGSTGFTYSMVNASFRFFRIAKMIEARKNLRRNSGEK